MATHVIHQKSRIDLSQISHMLIAAGLGAGLMFILDATFLKASDAEINSLRSEKQRIEAVNIGIEAQVRDLSARNQDLQIGLENLIKEKDLLGDKLAAKEADLLAKEKNLENLNRTASKLNSDAKVLSACVLDDQNNINSAKELLSDAMHLELGLGNIPEVLVFMNSFHSSWSTGNCASASNIAGEYQSQ